MLASALLTYSEQLINELNERARRDALDTARREVDRAEQRIAEIQSELTAYRVKQKMLDPKSASAGVLELIGQMNAAQANAARSSASSSRIRRTARRSRWSRRGSPRSTN